MAIDGAGTLGRRIASVYAAGGTAVHIFDLSADQRKAAREYAVDHMDETRKALGLNGSRAGRVDVFERTSPRPFTAPGS